MNWKDKIKIPAKSSGYFKELENELNLEIMSSKKLYTIELSDSNYESKYEIWTIEGYSFDKNEPIHVGHFYTKQEIDRYIKSVGIHKCPEDCFCK